MSDNDVAVALARMQQQIANLQQQFMSLQDQVLRHERSHELWSTEVRQTMYRVLGAIITAGALAAGGIVWAIILA